MNRSARGGQHLLGVLGTVAVVRSAWEDGARLVVAGTFEDAGGITFYTGLPTYMLDVHDADLLFGYRRGDARDLFLTQADFDALWRSPAPVFLLTQADRQLPSGTLLLETPRHQLLVNRR